jgi:hypothetical protein
MSRSRIIEHRRIRQNQHAKLAGIPSRAGGFVEPLECRRMLSANPMGPSGGRGQGGPVGGRTAPVGPGGDAGATIVFSLAPAVVQSGLTALAAADSDPAPTTTTIVRLGNRNGVETYSIFEGTGSPTADSSSTTDNATATPPPQIMVDVDGNPVTAPTQTTTTFGAITNTAVTSELTAIASALNVTAPSSTTGVDVITASDGTAIYAINFASPVALAGSGSSATSATADTGPRNGGGGGIRISVDASGNPVGQEQVPLSVLSTAVQAGLTSHAPAGATALTSASLIDVATIDGVTLYTAHYSGTGTQTTVTVNIAGTLASLPSSTQVDFSTLPAAARAELQTLADADGYTGAISNTQQVTVYAEPNGTVIYCVSLQLTGTDTTTSSTIGIAVDAAGNPTVPPMGGFAGPGGGLACEPGSGATPDGSGASTDSSTDPANSTNCNPTTTSTTTAATTTTTTTASTRASKIAAAKAAIAAKKAAVFAAIQQKKAAALAAKKAAATAKAAAKAAKLAAIQAAREAAV